MAADDVMREYDAESKSKSTYQVADDGKTIERVEGPQFPCSHCSWLTRCLEVGQGTIAAPELPLKVGDEAIGVE